MYDMKTILETFPTAEMVGGRLIATIDGKRIELGRTAPKAGVFALTPQGQELLNGASGGVVIGAAPAHAAEIPADAALKS